MPADGSWRQRQQLPAQADGARHLSDDTIGTRRPTDRSRPGVHHYPHGQSANRFLTEDMAPVTLTPKPHRPRSRLRLVPGERRQAGAGRLAEAPDGSADASVLIAGADASSRARMIEELRGLLPDGTPFAEASETWQVLTKASTSRMVILTGELGDISARGLMRVLSRRYPLLPVVALGDAGYPGDGDKPGIASL
jgi:hypothetical protein